MSRIAVAAVTLGLAAGQAWAAQGVVEATGEAQIKGGDKIQAKKAATADALKRCIEQVVGISIKSDFSAEQKEVVHNNQSDFESRVRDSLVQKSEGFIQSYDVLSEKIEGDIIKVTVRAQVFESKIRAEVKKLADLIAAAGNPKLMLAIQEVYVSEAGEKRVAQDSVLASYLEKALLERGFELKGKGSAEQVAGDSVATFDAWLSDTSAIGVAARASGADIVIAGRVEISNKGKISEEESGGLSALQGQTRIEIAATIRGINAATGAMLSSKPVQMKSMGTSEERAVHRAFKGRGKNLVKTVFGDLLADLKRGFREAAEKGQSYVVVLSGVKSFRKQGRGFMKLLKALDGVQSVTQKSFRGGNLTVELACKCSSNELQERVFSASDDNQHLANLDIEGVSGKRLAFKLE